MSILIIVLMCVLLIGLLTQRKTEAIGVVLSASYVNKSFLVSDVSSVDIVGQDLLVKIKKNGKIRHIFTNNMCKPKKGDAVKILIENSLFSFWDSSYTLIEQ